MMLAAAAACSCFALVAAAGQTAAGTPGARIVHVVLVWLKDPGNEAHRRTIIDSTRSFATLPGIEEIRVGAPVASERAAVDDSFDVGLYMTFESADALEAYLENPVHRDAQRSVLSPLVERVLVYDFYDDPP